MKRAFVAVGMASGLLFTGACSITSDGVTDPSFQTLRYEGGFSQGSKFKECVPAGEKMVSDDTYYPYPTSQREDRWDSDNFEQGTNSADYGDLKVTDKDGRNVFVKMKIQFYLNTSCEPVTVDGKRYEGGVLQAYHEKIGKTRKAYFKSDGSYGKGWLWSMDNYISSVAVSYVADEVKKMKVQDIYGNPEIKSALEEGLDSKIQEMVDAGMESDLQFYKNFKVRIDRITPDASYLDLIRGAEDAKIQAKIAEDNANAEIRKAEAGTRVAKAKAATRKAEIEGYGSEQNYRCLIMAEKGLNCDQPTYVIGAPR